MSAAKYALVHTHGETLTVVAGFASEAEARDWQASRAAGTSDRLLFTPTGLHVLPVLTPAEAEALAGMAENEERPLAQVRAERVARDKAEAAEKRRAEAEAKRLREEREAAAKQAEADTEAARKAWEALAQSHGLVTEGSRRALLNYLAGGSVPEPEPVDWQDPG